jgi:23S rRNA (pseudouridine1915-N3)-methyltransferase
MRPDAKWEVREVERLDTLPADDSLVILLDDAGKTFDSKTFARQLDRWAEGGARPLTFVIGGAFGFTDEIKKGAHVRLSLSPMTMPHDLARVVLLEQIYRAVTIQQGKRYHK